MKFSISFVSVVLVLSVGSLPAIAQTSDTGPAVNYISAEAVYVNVGSAAGLSIGSRIEVMRKARVIAVLEIMYISSHSASCRIVSKSAEPRVGDVVRYDRSSLSKTEAAPPRVRIPSLPEPNREFKRRAVRGHISLQNQWYRDLGGSGLSSVQPGVTARISVDDIFGTGGTLRIRHHTRLYHRSRALSTEPTTNEWSHRLSECGFYFPLHDDPDAIGFGRIINPHMRGLGYLDGGYVALRILPQIRFGLAGGMDPSIEDSSFQPHHQRYGVFMTYEAGSQVISRLITTLALSGSYKEGTIDREFGYVQNVLSVGRRLSMYHSMEVELNRGWRKTADGSRISFSNMVVTTNVSISRWLSLDMSYDARRNIRDYNVIDSPDSLFNDAFATGYSGGVSLSMPGNVRFRARGGERRRGNDDYANRFGSVSLHVQSFPRRGHSILARMLVSETPYVTGYHSLIAYRFPLMRRTRVNLGGGGYVYKQAFVTMSSTFGELGVHHTLGRRYYVSGNLRWLTGSDLNSTQLLTEAGLSF